MTDWLTYCTPCSLGIRSWLRDPLDLWAYKRRNGYTWTPAWYCTVIQQGTSENRFKDQLKRFGLSWKIGSFSRGMLSIYKVSSTVSYSPGGWFGKQNWARATNHQRLGRCLQFTRIGLVIWPIFRSLYLPTPRNPISEVVIAMVKSSLERPLIPPPSTLQINPKDITPRSQSHHARLHKTMVKLPFNSVHRLSSHPSRIIEYTCMLCLSRTAISYQSIFPICIPSEENQNQNPPQIVLDCPIRAFQMCVMPRLIDENKRT